MPDLIPLSLSMMMTQEVRQAFDTLGLTHDSSIEEVKRVYKEKAGEYHPDKVNSLPKEFRDLAHEKMVKFTNAFDTLKEFFSRIKNDSQ
jgi:DnaJ-class molecular chaperone